MFFFHIPFEEVLTNTIIACTTAHAINPSLYKLNFDTLKAFTHVTMHLGASLLLVVHPSVPANSVSELIALAKAQPGKLTFASYGTGSPGHLSGELFMKLTGTEMLHIPYKGSGVGMNDVLAGQVQMMFINLLPATPFVANGRLRGLGVTSAKRSAAAPDIPTIAESGFPGYQSTSWHGFVAPIKVPAPIIRQLHGELVKIVNNPETKKRMAGQGTDVIGSTPEEFRKVIQTESAKWANVIKTTGIKPE